MFGKKHEVTVQIDATLTWKVGRDPRTGEYLGVCEMLNLNAVGDTFPEFQECAAEAIELLFKDLFEDNEFEAFLRQHGWRHVGRLPGKGEVPRFDVPFSVEYEREFSALGPARA